MQNTSVENKLRSGKFVGMFVRAGAQADISDSTTRIGEEGQDNILCLITFTKLNYTTSTLTSISSTHRHTLEETLLHMIAKP